jgi:hypothetical protein
MKTLTKLAVIALFGFAMTTSVATAGSINKGQSIYGKKIKGQCGDKPATDLTQKYKQKEWEAALKDGTFVEKVKTVCPDVKYKDKWTPHLFEFVYEYAKDGEDLAC